jgi:YidC/Oxa1 family membrane protein insertase
MDRKTIVAVVLSLLFLVAYPYILRFLGLGHHIDPPKRHAVHDTTAVAGDADSLAVRGVEGRRVEAGSAEGGAQTPRASLAAPPARPQRAALERSIVVETPLYRAQFSTVGARIQSVSLKHYASAHGASSLEGRIVRPKPGESVEPGDRVVLAGAPLFVLDVGAGAGRRSLDGLAYTAAESLDAAGDVRAITFTHQDSAGFAVRQTYRVRPTDYAIDLEVELRNVPAGWNVTDYSLNTRSWPLVTEADLEADQRGLRASSLVGENMHREGSGGLMKGDKTFEGSAEWAGVQNRYFLAAAALVEGNSRGVRSGGARVPPSPELTAIAGAKAREQHVVTNALVVGLPPQADPVDHFLLYFGPIEYSRLSRLESGLVRSVDLGWRWLEPFSKALLQVLVWIYAVVGNYGVAIVLLATLVRVVLHPLNMVSMRSMRAMQKLQPEIERMRQKYKNDPQAMNAAMMALYKEHKVNPAGGCLPLLLQMPLFIALYSVLYNAIELRQAAFGLWINDLSAPDHLFGVAGFPIRLLPVLMAATGFLQQKMMPTDPRQAPTMYMMNAMMLVFFYNLPSGLVLYWTVMNVLTMAQQWLMMRQDRPTAAPSEAVVLDEPEKGRGRKGRPAVARKPAEK